MKTLLTCPISDNKQYVMRRWLDHMLQLQGEFDILLVDNSHDPEWHKQYITDRIRILRVDPMDLENREYICRSRNLARDYFLQGEYDYFFSLECDIFPPPDILGKLFLHNLPIVNACYFIGLGKLSSPCFMLFDVIEEINFVRFYMAPFLQAMNLFNGKLVQMGGAGLGCTLISRPVIEAIPFRIIKNQVGHDDAFFFQDLWFHAIDNFADTSIICKHINSDWNRISDHDNSRLTKLENLFKKQMNKPIDTRQLVKIFQKKIDILEGLQNTLTNQFILAKKNLEAAKTDSELLQWRETMKRKQLEVFDLELEIQSKTLALVEYTQRSKEEKESTIIKP